MPVAKTFAALSLLTVSLTCQFASADTKTALLPCAYQAAIAVVQTYPERFEYSEEIQAKRSVSHVECKDGPNYRSVICDVGATNPPEVGAGDMTFQVVLDASCKNVLSIEITGEE